MSKLDVDAGLIETLAALLDRTGLREIEIAEGDSRIRVVKDGSGPPPGPLPAAAPGAVVAAAATAETVREGTVHSPMVGTVYLAPEPGAAPFVSVGQRVQEGQTILIVEAMKVMNPIRAPRGGTIMEILVQNASPVEFGEPLLVIA